MVRCRGEAWKATVIKLNFLLGGVWGEENVQQHILLYVHTLHGAYIDVLYSPIQDRAQKLAKKIGDLWLTLVSRGSGRRARVGTLYYRCANGSSLGI